MFKKLRKFFCFLICFFLLFEQSGFAQVAVQLDIASHLAGLHSSFVQDKFRPLHLRYLAYNSQDNIFRLLLDKGDLKDPKPEFLEDTSKTLLKYFLIGLSLPNDSFWVNLRPDSPDNIIDPFLEQTDIGKIMLETDLELKKDTAQFTSPETPEGKEYWDKLYKKAEELFGYENITIPTLTRPWIVPGEIIIRESPDSVYIYKATLKVMLEQDYLKDSTVYSFKDPRFKELNEYSSELIRQLIIPKLTKEVNSSKRYAVLRQVYYSLIMAQWFKARNSGKGDIYSKLIDNRNLTNFVSKESWSKSTYFQAYQKSFKDGEYNIKEQRTTPFGQTIRSYFSGGEQLFLRSIPIAGDSAGTVTVLATARAVPRDGRLFPQALRGGVPGEETLMPEIPELFQGSLENGHLSVETTAALQRQLYDLLKTGVTQQEIIRIFQSGLNKTALLYQALLELQEKIDGQEDYEVDLRFMDHLGLREDEKQLAVFIINAGQGKPRNKPKKPGPSGDVVVVPNVTKKQEDNTDIVQRIRNIARFTQRLSDVSLPGIYSTIEGDTRYILKYLEASDSVPQELREKIVQNCHALLRKLKPEINELMVFVLEDLIQIIGRAGISSPQIKQDLLELFQGGIRQSKNGGLANLYKLCALFSGEALGRLYGKEVLPELVKYRSYTRLDEWASSEIGEDVEVYQGEVLEGAMLGFGAMNTPEAVKEIFMILTMRLPYQFYQRNSEQYGERAGYAGEPLYKLFINMSLVDAAVIALGRTDEKIIRETFENNFTDAELAKLLREYYDIGMEEDSRPRPATFMDNYWMIYSPESLFKLTLPYISAGKLARAMNLLLPEEREDIMRFAPYGLKADIIETVRSQKLAFFHEREVEEWDVRELRRKQQKLNAGAIDVSLGYLSDTEIEGVLAELDKTVDDARRGFTGSMSGMTAGEMSVLEIVRFLLPEAPAIKDFISRGPLERRIAAARQLQIPEVQKRLLRKINTPFLSGVDGMSLTRGVLVSIFRLNPGFGLRYLCQEISSNRLANAQVLEARENRRSVTRYLGLLGDTVAMPVLAAQAMNSCIPYERDRAIESLARIGDPWALEIIQDIIQETRDERLKKLAIQKLGSIKAAALPKVIRFLAREQGDNENAQDYLVALVLSGDRDALERTLKIMESNQPVELGDEIIKPAHFLAVLWESLLPRAMLVGPKPDKETLWYRGALDRVGRYTVGQVKVLADRVLAGEISDFELTDRLASLFDKLTAVPSEVAQSWLDEALPDDKEFGNTLLAIAPAVARYPAMRKVLAYRRTARVFAIFKTEFPERGGDQRLLLALGAGNEETGVENRRIELSTGMVLEGIQPRDNSAAYPCVEIMPALFSLMRTQGVHEASMQRVLDTLRDHLQKKLGRALPVCKAEIVPHEIIARLPTGKPNTMMIVFFDVLDRHIQIYVSEENCRGISPENFVIGLTHEVFSQWLIPNAVPDALAKISPVQRTRVISQLHPVHLSEGLANFQTEIPFRRETIITYADALRDGIFEEVLKNRGIVNHDQIRQIREDWFRNPHPLGYLLFDALSRINSQEMWNYAFSFYDRVLKGDFSVENLQRVDLARIMYEDYVKLSEYLGEVPYPKYVFFEAGTGGNIDSVEGGMAAPALVEQWIEKRNVDSLADHLTRNGGSEAAVVAERERIVAGWTEEQKASLQSALANHLNAINSNEARLSAVLVTVPKYSSPHPRINTQRDAKDSSEQDAVGGIDFRSLPIVTQAIHNLSINADILSLSRLNSLELAREWEDIQKLVNSGISPSSERIKEYVLASCFQGDSIIDTNKVILCISDILRTEEESYSITDPTLRDILVMLESTKGISELKNILIGK